MATSLTQIRDILRSCQFNPKKPGPMKVIAEVGNPQYYRLRAIELLSGTPTELEIKQAISLLALCLAEGTDAEEKD